MARRGPRGPRRGSRGRVEFVCDLKGDWAGGERGAYGRPRLKQKELPHPELQLEGEMGRHLGGRQDLFSVFWVAGGCSDLAMRTEGQRARSRGPGCAPLPRAHWPLHLDPRTGPSRWSQHIPMGTSSAPAPRVASPQTPSDPRGPDLCWEGLGGVGNPH